MVNAHEDEDVDTKLTIDPPELSTRIHSKLSTKATSQAKLSITWKPQFAKEWACDSISDY